MKQATIPNELATYEEVLSILFVPITRQQLLLDGRTGAFPKCVRRGSQKSPAYWVRREVLDFMRKRWGDVLSERVDELECSEFAKGAKLPNKAKKNG